MEKFTFLITPALIVLVTFIAGRVVAFLFDRAIKKSSEKLNSNPTAFKFIKHIAVALVYVLGFGFAASTVPQLSGIGASMLAGAGVLTVVVGFASQAALANVVAGIFIVIFKPFKINDRIVIKKEFSGVVEDINLRHTVIRNMNSQRIIVPNSVMSSEVVLNSDFIEDKICRHLEFGIAYDANMDLARKVISEEIEKHPLYLDTRTEENIANGDPKVVVRVINWAESAITLRAWAWARNMGDGFNIQCDVLESIKKRFDEEGVEIPYPHRTVVQKGMQ